MFDKQPTVYIGIVAYNSLADLPDCLRCLSNQTYSRLTITLLDNASSDGAIAWVQTNWPQVYVIANDYNAGFGSGHNRIIDQLNIGPEDCYLALNPDVRLQPDYVAQMVNGLFAAGAAWGTGQLFLPDGERLYSIGHALLKGGYAFNIGHGLAAAQVNTDSREVFGAPGAAMMCRGSLIQTLMARDGEFFDTQMFLYGEDVDLDWRARRAGFRCWYVAEAVAYHRGSTPSSKLRDEALINRFTMTIKNACLLDLVLYNLPWIAIHCIARLFFTPRRGWRIIRELAKRRITICNQRRQSSYGLCPIIHQWFVWSEQQSATTPRTITDRLRAFYQVHFMRSNP